MRRTRATYLICASLGRGIGKGETEKEKQKASLCIRHAQGSARCSQPLAAVTTAVCVPRGAHPAQAAPLAGPLTALSTPPAAGAAATGHRVLAWDRATRALNPPGPRQTLSVAAGRVTLPSPGACSRGSAARPHSSFWGELCLQLEIRGQLGAREQLQALQPLHFSPAGQVASGQRLCLPAGCSLFLLNAPPLWFLHRAGLSWA